MMYAGRTLLCVALVATCAVAFPNHLKAKGDDLDVIPKVTSVSASAGGFSAQAGVDRADGPFVSAGLPVGEAGVGVGGAGASAGGAVTGHKPVTPQGPTVFDNIFNIPISVLQAVNTYLNNREPIRPVRPINRKHGHHPARPADPAVPSGDDKVDTSPVVESGVDSPAPPPAPGGHPQGHVVKRVNFDQIFAIPISALKSVNQMLNGKK